MEFVTFVELAGHIVDIVLITISLGTPYKCIAYHIVGRSHSEHTGFRILGRTGCIDYHHTGDSLHHSPAGCSTAGTDRIRRIADQVGKRRRLAEMMLLLAEMTLRQL